jgi:hypothetical protein
MIALLDVFLSRIKGIPTSEASTTTEKSDTVVTDRYGSPVPMGWNWGAFLLPLWWALYHHVPIRHWGWTIDLGLKGSRPAWENGQWDSAEHFIRVQRRWAKCGFVVLGCLIAVFSME